MELDLIKNLSRQSMPQVVDGVIATSPASDSELVYVTIPSFDPSYRWGPAPWAPRGTARPVRGDRCVVLQSSPSQTIWVVGWWHG